MATMKINAGGEWLEKITQLGRQSDAVCARAVAKAAGIVADQIRQNLEALPEDAHYSPAHPDYYFLTEGEIFTGIPTAQKEDLLDSLGITPVKVDERGVINAKIGFDGYGSQPTAAYPKGIPNPMVARAVESGTSFRPKQPFVRPAVNKAKKAALEAMQQVVEQAIESVMNK